MDSMLEEVTDLLARTGPRTGAELLGELDCAKFQLWRTCLGSPALTVRRVGRRYVRLDRRVDGYARLSPSILREFLTYTVVGLAGQEGAVAARAAQLQGHIDEVSTRKLELSQRIVADILAPLATGTPELEDRFCVVLAGDIVYQMAHDVNRPERSTGAMVHGSDLDIVVVVDDSAPEELLVELDEVIYKKKYQYLRNPAFREEIDYIVKRFDALRDQSRFDTFKRMVACKIFDEAVLLHGSRALFEAGKELLEQRGVTEQLRQMERAAVWAREEQEKYLLVTEQRILGEDDLLLFHTDEESEEFE
jgi:hypothetical protein